MATTHSRKKRRMDRTGDFDLVVVGCGGGHDETNLSGYLFKPKDKPWSAGLLGLEAGSGYGALKRLLGTTHPRLFSSLFSSPPPPTDKKRTSGSKLPLSPIEKAQTVYSHLRAYLLTHAHLDHAASLVISSGSLSGPTKYILGARGVLEDLERCIWGPGRCWPGIVGWENEMDNGGSESGSESSVSTNTAGGILRALKVAPSLPDDTQGDRDEEYTPIGLGIDNVSVRTVAVSHGCGPKGPDADEDNGSAICNGHSAHSPQGDVYKSSAFFIRHALTRHEFLFFGDVEADPVPPSSPQSPLSPPSSRPLLRPIWEHTAHLFTTHRLHTLLIECSYPAGRPETQLYGHLSVEGLRREMRALAQEVLKIRDNKGVAAPPTKTEIETDQTLQAVDNTPSPRRSRRTRPTDSDLVHHPTKPSKRKAVSDPNPTADPLSGALTGLRVIVIHCKDPAPGFDLAGAPTIADFIVRQLKEGVPAGKTGVALGPDELGVNYVAAHQGDEFVL